MPDSNEGYERFYAMCAVLDERVGFYFYDEQEFRELADALAKVLGMQTPDEMLAAAA